MALLGTVLTIPFDPKLIDSKEVLRQWHMDAKELGNLEETLIANRVIVRAFDTGALAADIVNDANTYADSDEPLLACIFVDDHHQMATWGRVYVEFQEGPPLGLPTFTNEPRLLFFDAQYDDLPFIEAWAEVEVAKAIARMTATGTP